MIELSVKTEAHVKVVLQIKDIAVCVLRTSSQPILKKVFCNFIATQSSSFCYKDSCKNDLMLLIFP